MTLAIETHHLTRYFDDFCAVRGIDLRVERGTFYGFLGPNGAGKSTTIKMLTGLLAPTQGKVLVLGHDMLDPPAALEAKRHVGVVPEDLALFDNLTAREYLTFVGRMYLLPRDTVRCRTDELLGLLDLAGEEKKLAMEYSHGMQKKLALAAALLPNPDLLFLDEPFEGVDAVTSRVIRDLLAGFVARGSTVFLTSHVLEIVERLCTHVGIIVKGELVEQAALEDIRQGSSLETRFLERAGADAAATARLSWLEEGALVNRQHLLAFLWLRWRLRVNQVKKAGTVNAVITAVFAAALVPAALGLFVGALLTGWLLVPLAEEHVPIVVLFAWDALVLAFLFLWAIGVLADLQRAEVLSLNKFLHLPVSLSGAFLINYLASLFSVNLLIFLPAMLGLAVGLAVSQGPAMLLVLPLLAAFVLATTALTYQFQGWLASLMTNPRRRRTVIVLLTLGFVLLAQVPNAVNLFVRPWERSGPNEVVANRQREEIELKVELATKKITPEQYQQRGQEIERRYKERQAEQDRETWAEVAWTGRLLNLVLPPGWLPLGAMDAAEGNVLPALLGTAGLALIGAVSLWRAYRTTVRLYTGQYTAGKVRPSAAPTPTAAPAGQVAGVRLLERRLPWVPEQAAAIALASFRSLLRAPEAKMMLLSPIILLVIFGGMFLTRRIDMPEPVRPLLVIGAMSMILMTMVQFIGNQFGFDRNGFRVFVLCPVPRRDVLLGKNLAVAPFALGMGLAMAVVVETVYPMRPDYLLAAPVQMVAMYLAFCLLANWVSILAPLPIAPGTMRPTNQKPVPLLIMGLFATLFPIALAPTLLPLGVAALLDWQGWAVGVPVCLPLSLLVCAAFAGLYWLVLPLQGRLLQKREQKILDVVTAKAE